MRLAGAVDIGGTRTKLGIVAEDGSVRARGTIRTSARGEPTSLVEGIAAALAPMLRAADARGERVVGVGVSVAGFLDPAHDAMVMNANLPDLAGFPLRAALEGRLALGCRLEVDSNASTVAEHRFGAGRGAARLLGITIGTGVGGGVIVDGALLRYTGECAGDLGQIVIAPGGRRCSCGARGCLEAMVCSAALSERMGKRPAREIVWRARRGERRAVEALAETGRWLGLGLASLAPIYFPDRIVVGGGIAAAGDLLLEPARASFRRHSSPTLAARVSILGSGFDGWEGMIGAASLVFERS